MKKKKRILIATLRKSRVQYSLPSIPLQPSCPIIMNSRYPSRRQEALWESKEMTANGRFTLYGKHTLEVHFLLASYSGRDYKSVLQVSSPGYVFWK